MHRFPFTRARTNSRFGQRVGYAGRRNKIKEKKKKGKGKKRKERGENVEKKVKEEGRREWNTSRTGKKRLCPIGELYGLGMGHSVPLSDPL